MYIIYQIKCLVNGKIYIGYTSRSLEKRWKEHLLCKLDTKFYRALKKYGIKNFSMSVIETYETKKEALSKEKYWIEKLNTISEGYNTHEGGLGGKTRTKEQIESLSKRMSGKNNPMYGSSYTDEWKNRHSQKMKEYFKNEPEEKKKERLKKNSVAQKGKPKKPESIEKMRLSKKDRLKNIEQTRCQYEIISPDNEKITLTGKKELTLWCKNNNKSLWTIERILLKNNQPKSGDLVGWKASVSSCPLLPAYI